MPSQILLNLFITFLWMFLQDQWTFFTFITGYLVGMIILIFIRRFFKGQLYIYKVWAILKLFAVFIYELIISGFFVIKHVLRPKVDVTPGIFRLDVDLEGEVEVTLLSLLITLTPGSVVMEVTPDGKALYVHALDLPDSKISVKKSQKVFEKAIKDVTRNV